MTNWQVFPSKHSVMLKAMPVAAAEGASDGHDPERSFLQHNDVLLEASIEPALSLLLSDDELAELRDERLAAATHFGPEIQEKASNEDFALSAVIRTSEGREFSFAAVGDGVSSRTFWSARAARLSCLGAYKAVRARILQGTDPGEQERHAELATHVAAVVNDALLQDAAILENNDAVPIGWDPTIYGRHKQDKAAWYRSTLLFGIIGPNGGVLGVTGDGGIRALLLDEPRQKQPTEIRVMSAEAGRELTSYVSVGFSESDIRLVPLRPSDRVATHVVFASDGLDLTLQAYKPNEADDSGRRCHSRYRDLPLDNGETAFDFLDAVARRKEANIDNLSVARLTWPLPNKGSKWAAWRTERLDRWRLADQEDDRPAATLFERLAKTRTLMPFSSWAVRSVESAKNIPDGGTTNWLPPRPGWFIPGLLGFVLGSITTLGVVLGVRGFMPTTNLLEPLRTPSPCAIWDESALQIGDPEPVAR